jgi:hypothetical protein
MRTKSMVVQEYTGMSGDPHHQACKNVNSEWIRVELKGALLDIGVPGTRADHTHALARQL